MEYFAGIDFRKYKILSDLSRVTPRGGYPHQPFIERKVFSASR